VITLDQEGKEHHRTVGFLAPEEFIPSLRLGIAKTHFDREKFSEAIALFEGILKDFPKSDAAPEAVYLRGVALYKSTHNAENLKDAYKRLQAEYPSSEWARRAHEILGEVPDAVQVDSDGMRAVAFEEEIGFHLFLKFSHGFPP